MFGWPNLFPKHRPSDSQGTRSCVFLSELNISLASSTKTSEHTQKKTTRYKNKQRRVNYLYTSFTRDLLHKEKENNLYITREYDNYINIFLFIHCPTITKHIIYKKNYLLKGQIRINSLTFNLTHA